MNFLSVLKTDAKRRNPITNFALCAIQVLSIVAAIVLFPDVLRSFDLFEDKPQWNLVADAYGDGFIPAWLAAISAALCNLLTLKWKKSGLLIMLVSFLLICIPLALNEYIEFVTFLGIMYGGLLIYLLILRLKKNGVSVWSQCSGCYRIANCVIVSIALFLIGLLPPVVGYTIGFKGDLYRKGCHYLDAHLTSSYFCKYRMGKDIAFSSLWRKEEWSRKSDAEYWFQSAMYSAKNNYDNKSALARVYAGHICFLLKVGDSETAKKKYLEALEYVEKDDLRKMIAFDDILKEYLAYYDNIVGSSAKPTTSTRPTTSAQKHSRAPIKSGTYVRSGQGYCWETMQFTPPSSDWTLSVEFYDDHIVVGGEWCDYKKTNSRGIKYYTGSYCTFTVSPNYVMSCIDYGMYTIEYEMTLQGVLASGEKMQSVIQENIGTGGGVNVPNEYNSVESTSGSPSSGVKARTPKKCGLCSGKGWIASTKGVPDFGTGNIWCKECNRSVPPNHYHETCPSCNGKGSW